MMSFILNRLRSSNRHARDHARHIAGQECGCRSLNDLMGISICDGDTLWFYDTSRYSISKPVSLLSRFGKF